MKIEILPKIRYCNEQEWKSICKFMDLDFEKINEFTDYQMCKQGIVFKMIRYKDYKEI